MGSITSISFVTAGFCSPLDLNPGIFLDMIHFLMDLHTILAGFMYFHMKYPVLFHYCNMLLIGFAPDSPLHRKDNSIVHHMEYHMASGQVDQGTGSG